MDSEEIRNQIKGFISNAANIDPSQIGDKASYKDDLGLDSLTMLEISVDLESEFDLIVPEEEFANIKTLQDSVDLVQKYLAAK
jgi:acyl carrier protein